MRNLRGIIPDYIHKLLGHYSDIEEVQLPLIHREDMAALFTDIKAFTRLTEQVSQEGHYGVETITAILKSYFEVMENCIRTHGGSLVKFGGDSLLSVFPGGESEAIRCAVCCSNSMQHELKELNIDFLRQYGVQIQIHGGISWGNVALRIVGDLQYHLDYYFYGEALQQAYEVGETSGAGEIKLHDSHKKPISNHHECTPLTVADSGFSSHFIGGMVKSRISAMEFSAELRNAAVMFIGISSESTEETISCEVYHSFYKLVQQQVYAMEGTINKIDYNDKGFILIITFGVPNIHYDDTERAFICAWKLQQIRDINLDIRIGITYSNIFAGTLGSERRWEYGIIGNAVNISARLMSTARNGEIAFSSEILPKISSHFESKFLNRVRVKGIKDEIDIYTPVRELPESWTAFKQQYDRQDFAGIHRFDNEINEFTNSGQGSIVYISGHAGTGKSFLTYELLKRGITEDRNFDLYVMDEFSRNTPLEFIRKALNRKLNIEQLPQDLPKLLSWCEAHKIFASDSLLERYFSTTASKDSEAIPEESIAIVEQTLASILLMLWKDVDILALDNYQWLDRQSRKIVERTIPLLERENSDVIITSRETDSPERFEHLNLRRITLENLEVEDATALIRSKIPNITGDAARNLVKITDGNPMFIYEMCRLIQANFDCHDNILNEANISIMLRQGIIPQTLENLFVRQYENLEDASRQLLKVASIVGRAFSIDALSVIGKAEFSQRVLEILQMLNAIEIINEKNINPEIEYIFSNNLMREAIYRTILKGEKRDLHNRIAHYYEERHRGNLHPWIELIANHFILADNPEKSCHYALLAARKNFRLFALAESAYFFRIAEKHCSDAAQKIEIDLHIIEILLLQGDTSEAKRCLEATQLTDLSGPTLDYYHYLLARLYDKTSRYHEQIQFVESVIDSMTDRERYHQVKILYLNALRGTGKGFEEQALSFLEEVKNTDNDRIIAQMASILGQYYLDQSRYENARKFFEQRYEIALKLKDQVQTRLALTGLGALAFYLGKTDEAERYHLQALETAEKLGDKDGYGKVLMDLASLARRRGNNQKALETYRKSLKLARLSANRKQECTVLYNIGEVHYFMEAFEKALEYLYPALEIAREISDQVMITYCQDAIGDMTFQLGNIAEAKKMYTNNLQFQERLNDLEGIAHTYGNLGNVAKMEKNYKLAIEYYGKQQSMLAEIGDKDGEGRAWFNWAMIHVEKNEQDRAIEKLEKAHDLFAEIGAKQLVDFTQQQIDNLRTPASDGSE